MSQTKTLCRAERTGLTRRVLWWVAPITIALLIVFSLLPLRPRATLHGTPGHLALHITGFGLVALPSLLLTVTRAQRWIGLVCLGGLALAVEMGQCFVFQQRMEWEDVLLDCLGALSALALIRFGQITARKPA
jgi:hypothetical protein